MPIVEYPLNRKTIQAITQLIVERFQPEQIILLGSVARSDDMQNHIARTSDRFATPSQLSSYSDINDFRLK